MNFILKNNNIKTYIVAGLGNPGSEYEKNRHNCGFRAIDSLCKKWNIELTKTKFNGQYGEKKLKNGATEVRIIVLKPQTFMNNSGESIAAFAKFYKVLPEDIFVIYDDTDIDLAAIRIRKSGSAGSHNGMKSIVNCLGNENFPRIRIGIGKRMPNADMIKFVLGNFPEEQEKSMLEAFDKAAEAVDAIFKVGIDKAMNQYNTGKSQN